MNSQLSFQIITTLLVLTCCLNLSWAEYNRYKRRGQSSPPRPPPVPQYAKKWPHHPPRGPPASPVRGRPIPVHMPPNYKIPMGASPGTRPSVAAPVRNFWKNTQKNFRAPKPEKPFLSSPPIGTINNKEYDYHVQTNAIPSMHANTIKQVGEKGPIHTIPAPNLSPADKPAVIEEYKPAPEPINQQLHHHQKQGDFFQLHQYQVTESNEPSSLNLFRLQQQGFYQDLSGLQAQTSVHKAEAAAVHQAHKFNGGQLIQHPQNEVVIKTQEQHQQQPQINDVYQLLNYYPPHQSLEAFKFPHQQQQQQQQFLQENYQHQAPVQVNSNPSSDGKPDVEFYQQLEQIRNQNVASNRQQETHQPEYHSFNYEEQDRHKDDRSGSDLSSMVTADYSLEPAVAESSEILHSTIARNNPPSDVLAQSQYIQQYFGTRDENVADNNVEPDAKISKNLRETERDEDESKSDVIASAFYATLPNRQAAEALASLQAAGQLNSNNKAGIRQQQNPPPIGVSNGNDQDYKQTSDKRPEENDDSEVNYEDYPSEQFVSEKENDGKMEEDEPNAEPEETSVSFGNRIKPKRNK